MGRGKNRSAYCLRGRKAPTFPLDRRKTSKLCLTLIFTRRNVFFPGEMIFRYIKDRGKSCGRRRPKRFSSNLYSLIFKRLREVGHRSALQINIRVHRKCDNETFETNKYLKQMVHNSLVTSIHSYESDEDRLTEFTVKESTTMNKLTKVRL